MASKRNGDCIILQVSSFAAPDNEVSAKELCCTVNCVPAGKRLRGHFELQHKQVSLLKQSMLRSSRTLP
jgi:hypothetical protein